MRLPAILVALSLLPAAVHAYESASPEAATISRFTFAWPIGEGALKPRGASTKGTAVTLDAETADGLKRLHEAGFSGFASQRRAVPSMAGPPRVRFAFFLVATCDPPL